MDLDNYGGPTETHALQMSSQAVDHITASSCGTTYTHDQRGYPRFSPCDIGAFETNKIFLPIILR